MSQENTSEHSYRLGHAVCVIFLVGFILVTLAVVIEAFHRSELEQVVPLVIATPSDQ